MKSLLGNWYPGFGEVETFRRLPADVRSVLSDLCNENPDFIGEYLVPALGRLDAASKIQEEISLALLDQEHALGGLGATSPAAQKLIAARTQKVEAAKKAAADKAEAAKKAADDKAAAQDAKNRSMWWYTAPWYPAWVAHSRGARPFMHTSFVDWMLGYVKGKKDPSAFPEPPKDAPDHAWSVWIQVMYRVFRITPPAPPTGTPLYSVYRDALNRATHPGGTFGRIAQGIQEGVSKFGDILISVAGAVLSPFTGGASLLAAQVLVAADKARAAASHAKSAKKQAAANAAQLQQASDQQTRETQQQVDAFYAQNQSWFAQYGVTPDKWAKLTLDQKIEFIRAGAAGQMPVTPQPVLSPPSQSAGGPSYGGSGGGDSGGGLYPQGTYSSGGFVSPGVAQQPGQPAQAGMFDSSMVGLLAGGAALALLFGKPAKGRRTRRNPRRRRVA